MSSNSHSRPYLQVVDDILQILSIGFWWIHSDPAVRVVRPEENRDRRNGLAERVEDRRQKAADVAGRVGAKPPVDDVARPLKPRGDHRAPPALVAEGPLGQRVAEEDHFWPHQLLLHRGKVVISATIDQKRFLCYYFHIALVRHVEVHQKNPQKEGSCSKHT